MNRLLVVARDLDELTCVCEAMAIFTKLCDHSWVVEPLDSIRHISRLPHCGERVVLLTDVQALECSLDLGVVVCLPSRMSPLSAPGIEVILLNSTTGEEPTRIETRPGQRTFRVRRTEEDPEQTALRLAGILLPDVSRSFLNALPDAIAPRYRLALAGLVHDAKNGGGAHSNTDQHDLPLGIATDECTSEARHPGIAQLSFAARPYGTFAEVDGHGDITETVQRAGFRTLEALDMECCRILGGDTVTSLRMGATKYILDRLSGQPAVSVGGLGEKVSAELRCEKDRARSDRSVALTSPSDARSPGAADGVHEIVVESDQETDDIWFSRLWQKHKDRVYRAAVSRGLSHDEAGDVVAEVWAKIWENRTELRRRKLAGQYFWDAGQRRALNHRRDRLSRTELLAKHQGRGPLNLKCGIDGGPVSERQHLGVFDARAAVEALAEPERTVIVLTCLEGWTAGEVGRLLGKTARSVEGVKRRTLQQVRRSWPALLPPAGR